MVPQVAVVVAVAFADVAFPSSAASAFVVAFAFVVAVASSFAAVVAAFAFAVVVAAVVVVAAQKAIAWHWPTNGSDGRHLFVSWWWWHWPAARSNVVGPLSFSTEP